MTGRVIPPGAGGNPPAHKRPARQWYIDEIVVAAFAFLGVGGAVFLPLHYGFTPTGGSVPPIVAALLLSTGLAALTYRYLGGIEGASFTVGTLKLGGALAALVGVGWFVNSKLTDQLHNTIQVWELTGNVVMGNGTSHDQMTGDDFLVIPANAYPGGNGDFRVRYIFDPDNPSRPYLTIRHGHYDPVTIPLEPEKIRKIYRRTTITGMVIDMGTSIPLHESSASGPYQDAPPPKPATQDQLAAYKSAMQSKPVDPGLQP